MDKYAPHGPQDVVRLVVEHSFGWLVTGAGETALASALPFRPQLDAEGRLTGLNGHMARSNPQVEALRADPHGLILLLGPHAYISPSWMADRTQAPTWNYVSGHFRVEVALVEEPVRLEALVRDLVAANEQGRPDAWSVEDMGERYARISRGIVGFEARLIEARPRFKLGQDERDDVFADILTGLESQGDAELMGWMKAYDHRKAEAG